MVRGKSHSAHRSNWLSMSMRCCSEVLSFELNQRHLCADSGLWVFVLVTNGAIYVWYKITTLGT